MTAKKVKIQFYGELYTYVELYQAAQLAFSHAKEQKPGREYNCMMSNLLIAFCLEAYLNHTCRESLPFWDDHMKQNINTRNKLRILCWHIGLEIDHSTPPYQTVGEIQKFRNLMVHADTEINRDELEQKIGERG